MARVESALQVACSRKERRLHGFHGSPVWPIFGPILIETPEAGAAWALLLGGCWQRRRKCFAAASTRGAG